MDNKIKILIASVLKPANDVRSCYKIGQSLAQTNKYEVNIIGFNSKKKVESKNIFLYPIFNFKRNAFKRLFAPLSILKKYLQLKPELIIVNTPELLWVIYIIKILFGTKIIYDIRENYKFNIKQNHIYKGIFQKIVFRYVQLMEAISKYFVDGYFLAEEIYEKQLNFIHKKPYIKLLNKTTLQIEQNVNPIAFSKNQAIKYIYSGTIGKEYGTLEAIEFCENLYKLNQKTTLTIIGYSADNKYLNLINTRIKNLNYIQLITDHQPIPQTEIINKIKESDIALLPYQLNPNISGRFPTKIYDYLALGIPMIIPPHDKWKSFIDQYHAGLNVDFTNPDIKKYEHDLLSQSFYHRFPKDEIQWKSQEQLLLDFMKNIMSK
ncbi:MAG: glycosyltransferase [Bacteroidota bacterium]